jgi:hypothetical protein
MPVPGKARRRPQDAGKKEDHMAAEIAKSKRDVSRKEAGGLPENL